jgi:hypothetical protein
MEIIKNILLKITIIAFVFYNYKTITMLFLLFHIIAVFEAIYTLKQPSFPVYNRYTNKFFKPILYSSIPDDMPIGSTIYYIYHNLVFNLMYFKIKYKSFLYIFKLLSLKNYINILFFIISGIGRLFVFLTIKIWKTDFNHSLNSILFHFFGTNSKDSRKIIKIDNEWVANGGVDDMFLLIKRIATTQQKIITTGQEMLIKQKLSKLLGEAKGTIEPTLAYNATFKDKNIRIPHQVYPDYSKGEESVGIIGYRTNLEKAKGAGNYGNQIIINQFEGDRESYDSTLLAYKESNLLQVSQEKLIMPTKLALGAFTYGHKADLLSRKAISDIEVIREVNNSLGDISLEIGIDINNQEILSTLFKII